MKTNLKNRLKIFIYSMLLMAISCDPEGSTSPFIAIDNPIKSEPPKQVIQPGIHNGPVTQLKSGPAYAWMEFKSEGILDKVGLVIPVKELSHQFSFPGGPNTLGMLEINMPETRGNQIFDQIILTYSPREQSLGLMKDPHINFNFYFNGSPSNCQMDCEMDHPLSRMPLGFHPLATESGCILGLGRLWVQHNEFYELHQAGVLLGSANDDLAFYSPTASMEVLANHPEFRGDIPLPPVMTPFRYYPTQYQILQIGNELQITLEKFVQKN